MNRCTINIVLGSGKCYEEKWDWEKESVVEGGEWCAILQKLRGKMLRKISYFTRVKRQDAEKD